MRSQGKRDVDRFLDQDPRVALSQQHGLAFGKRGGNGRAGLAHPASGIGFGLWRQCADLAVGEGKWGPIAGVREPQLLQLVEIRGTSDRGQGLVAKSLDLVGVQWAHLDGVVVAVRGGHGATLQSAKVCGING